MKQSQFLLLLGVICMCSQKEFAYLPGLIFFTGSFVVHIIEIVYKDKK